VMGVVRNFAVTVVGTKAVNQGMAPRPRILWG
jgi:hypothetical protein